MKNIGFFYNRLKRMSVPEIAYRVRQKAVSLKDKSVNPNKLIKSCLSSDLPCKKLFDREIDINDLDGFIKKADLVCSNVFDIFSLKSFYVGEKINYHKDYSSGLSACSNKYAKDINYRDSSKIGDIKYIWELNRHLHLPILAMAWHKTGNNKYLDSLQSQLNEWLIQNPFLRGVNWSSGLELGIRLINWTICWHLLSDHISPQLRQEWINSIYLHCWYLSRNFSRYSSANNHLIGEAAGLFIACTALPQFPNSKTWQKKAYDILIKECEKQNYDDGVNKEQAISYQQFVLDFLLLSGIIGKAYGINFPATYWNRLEKMMEFLASLENFQGDFPQIGDEDFGFVININQIEYSPYRSLLNTGAFIFNRKDFLKDNWPIDDKTLFLLNIGGFAPSCKPQEAKPLRFRFDEGGYYILGTGLNTDKEQKLIFDCGPLGYLSLAAHGHADSLSFYFSAGGMPILVDPGTYAYHANKKWRNYFRGTCAHNTVAIDSCDQSVITGNFMWGKRANSKLLGYSELTSVKGSHDGYIRLNGGVIHTRQISYQKPSNKWLIEDELISEDEHLAEVHFHIHPNCRVTEKNRKIVIEFEKGICTLEPDSASDISLHHGKEESLLGWYSPSYDTKIPCSTLKLKRKITKGTNKLLTSFSVEFHMD
ncbi:heparinase II/III family protein [Pseudobacteroides cellulosolvens]|uniref:Heparinase II/III family protein n=1 Tax=Pseudobacteroides cellulosolvens ATCC 35603 = DSM 2933 TaxID=398512 RepID=A0A0L6JLE6_9FIRM|nr:alginate lyase family protein [Pseudobacteroides cellulosolvens]KNY26589.1 Heparinase II/III family protein [Pseudobacteroides cellulosolvens ATCC 35603 = DSM 2933]